MIQTIVPDFMENTVFGLMALWNEGMGIINEVILMAREEGLMFQLCRSIHTSFFPLSLQLQGLNKMGKKGKEP